MAVKVIPVDRLSIKYNKDEFVHVVIVNDEDVAVVIGFVTGLIPNFITPDAESPLGNPPITDKVCDTTEQNPDADSPVR